MDHPVELTRIFKALKEVCEAMTLFNFFRFPMVFLCGVFLPVATMPLALRIAAWLLPLTYGVDALHQSLVQAQPLLPVWSDLLLLLAFTGGFFLAAERALRWRLRKDY